MIAVLAILLYLEWQLETYVFDRPSRLINFLSCLPTAAVLLVIVIAAFLELRRLARAAGIELLTVTGITATAILVTSAYWHRMLFSLDTYTPIAGILTSFPMLMFFFLSAMFVEQMMRRRTEGALRNIGATLLAVVYLGICGMLILNLRYHYGVKALVLFLVAVKCTDIGAYFTGTAIGKHKMIPWLSPGKSWEGLAGGLIFASIVSFLVDFHLHVLTAQSCLFHPSHVMSQLAQIRCMCPKQIVQQVTDP